MKTRAATVIACLLAWNACGVAVRADSTLYAVDSTFNGLYTLSTTTAQLTLVGTVSFQGYDSHILSDLTYDPVHNLLCGLDEGGGGILGASNGAIVAIDPQTAVATTIATIPQGDGAYVHGLAYDRLSDTFYYSSDYDGDLYRVDAKTGQTTKVGFIGSFSTLQQPYVDGLEFDPTTNVLYGCVSDWDDNGALVRIDTTTGQGTLIGYTRGMTDIAFQPGTNTLFGIDNGKGISPGSLYTVDLTTGAATLIGQIDNNSLLGAAFVPVPEPSTLALLALGSIGLLARRRFASKFVH